MKTCADIAGDQICHALRESIEQTEADRDNYHNTAVHLAGEIEHLRLGMLEASLIHPSLSAFALAVAERCRQALEDVDPEIAPRKSTG